MEPDTSSDAVADRVGTDGLAFPVVGIGASAGGFPALTTLLQNLPPVPDMALVVVLHLAPNERSSADRILQRATGLPVLQVGHTVPIRPNQVYVIPPDRSLAMEDGCLMPDELPRTPGDRTTIDMFFRTLAKAHRENAVGVVLSGMGADGTAGLACIKEQGGVTIVQLPADAEETGMPQAAIDAGMADFVLTAAQIPARLMELRRTAQAIRRRAQSGHPVDVPDVAPFDMGTDPERALGEVLALLHARTGHDFRQYKRPTLLRRLERRLQVRGLADLQGYCRLLGRDASEPRALLKDLLIGVTHFFRDPDAFAALERLVVPDLFRAKAPETAIRVWVAACSTGEEAYSLAMLLADAAAALARPPNFQIFASDIDTHALDIARAGLYPASIAADVPAARLQRHFTAENGGYKVRKSLRDRVLFAEHNLLRDPAFSRLDLVTCRNFLIYLNRETHQHLLGTFNFALDPGGYLMLGSAETADDAAHLFVPVDAARRIYRAQAPARPGLQAPAHSGARAPRVVPATRTAAPPAPLRGRLFSFAEIHLQKAAELAPPSILVNANAKVVHIAENASRYLRLSGGEPTRDIVALVAPELRLELRAALFRAHNSGAAAVTGPVHYRDRDGEHDVDMTVLPFHDEHAKDMLLLVVFRDVQAAPVRPLPAAAPGATQPDRLDEELRQTRDRLRATIDEADRAAAGMRAAHEELQTMVEELRAANHDLEARVATQQSINEEYKTVIRELQINLEETTRRSDDLANLIAASDAATLFLDRALRIGRYTPHVTDVFNVIPSDVGRPLTHLATRLDYPDLAGDAARVLETLAPEEREVRTDDGRCYIVRVQPYRTAEDRIEGVVMTFFDITNRRAAEQALHASQARLNAVFDSLPVGVGVTDAEGTVLLANAAMQRFLPGGELPSRDGVRGWRWQAVGADGAQVDPDDFPGARALRGERVVPGIEMRYRNDDHVEVWTQVAAVPIRSDDGRIVGQVSVVTDIDRQKRADAALRDSAARLRLALDASGMGAFEWDIERDVGDADARTMALFGFAPGSPMNLIRVMAERIHPGDAPQYMEAVRRALAPGGDGRLNEEVRLLLPGGILRWLAIRGQTFFGGTPPRPTHMIGTALDITARKEAGGSGTG